MIRRPLAFSRPEYKLPIDLIPSTTWYLNVRKLDTNAWQRIKASFKTTKQCVICGKTFSSKDKWTQRDVHEVFAYDESTKTQKLVKLEAICHLCHMAKHPGFMATDTSPVGVKKAEYVISHSCKINDITRDQYDDMLRTEIAIWNDRSKIKWEVDTSYVYEYLNSNKDMV